MCQKLQAILLPEEAFIWLSIPKSKLNITQENLNESNISEIDDVSLCGKMEEVGLLFELQKRHDQKSSHQLLSPTIN